MKHASGILDNKSLGNVVSELKKNIAAGCTLSVVSALFSLYAYDELKKELSKINNFRLLVPSLNDEESFLKNLHGDHLDRRLRNRLDVTRIARECSEWLQQKCEVRQLPASVHQNLIHLAHAENGEHLAIVGSSSFTTDGLGIIPSEAHHMNTCFRSSEEAHSLIKWFDGLWDSGRKSDDFGNILQEALALIYSDKTPQQIYFLTLFNIFRDFIGELDEDKIIKTQTGIKSTQVWQKLYKFQRDGVLGAIDKIERYNGCIIADSVGLGKRFEALAIIKYYELRNDRVLILCPKKLRKNWTLYTVNDKRNIMASDRFNYDVLNHTDLTRLRGMSGEINLETLNWGNYDLIVIDESHDFRNNPARKDERGGWQSISMNAQSGHATTSQFYKIETPGGRRLDPPSGRCWSVTKEKFLGLVNDNRIWFGKEGNNSPRLKSFKSEANLGLTPHTLWKADEVGTTDTSKKNLISLFEGTAVFDTPKPIELMYRIIQISTKPNDTILDLFAGTSPAAHAVMQLNAEDSGNRKFIMVQLPEPCNEKSEAFKAGYKTIAEISKKRIRRAAVKTKEDNPGYKGNLGFKVFKLDSTNIKPWEVDFDMTERTLEDFISNIKPARREEDVLYEILLKYGLDLTLPISEHAIAGQKVFDVGMGALLICLADSISLEVVEGMAKLKEELNPEIVRVVFKDSGFKDDVVKTNAVQILKQVGIVDVRSL